MTIQKDVQKSNQKQRVQEIKLELDKLVAKKASQSFLNKIASGYFQTSLWTKAIVGLIFSGIGVGIGFLMMPLLPTVWAIGGIMGLISYLIPSITLIQQHRSEEKYKEALSSEIFKLEHILQESIAAFEALQTPMNNLIDSLDKKNKEREKDNQTFKNVVEHFQDAVQDNHSALQVLEQENALMAHDHQILSETIKDSAASHRELHQRQNELKQINVSLYNTQHLLKKDADTFSKVTAQLQSSQLTLKNLDKKFLILEQQAQKNQEAIQQHIDQITQLVDEPALEESLEEQQESSEELQNRTLKNLSYYLSLRQKPYVVPETQFSREDHSSFNSMVH